MRKKLRSSTIYNTYFRPPKIGDDFGSLSEEELKYITAVSEVFYDTTTDRDTERLHKTVREWTENRTTKDGYFEVYRKGISAIKKITQEHECKTPFYNLSVEKRENILFDDKCIRPNLFEKPSLKNPFYSLIFILRSVLNKKKNHQLFCFEKLKKDIIRGIFSSQLGWDIVGNHSKPGDAGDPLSYTKPPSIN